MEISNKASKEISKQNQQVGGCKGTLTPPPLVSKPWSKRK